MLAACGAGDPGSDAPPDVAGAPAVVEGTDVAPSAPSAETVTTARVRRGDIRTRVTASGSIAARRSTALGPEVPGRLARVHVDVGDSVAREDPVFLIDPEPYEVRLDETVAGLELARAQLTDASDEKARLRQLVEKQMVSQQEYDRVRTRVTVARARVRQAESQVKRARNDLKRTLVRAPYAGSIVERRAHEGTMATVTPNTTVVVLQETSALEAILDIPEASLSVVRPGDHVQLYVEGVPEAIESTISIVSDRIDLASRTYQVRAPITDPSRRVKAGAFARGEVTPQTKSSVLLVDRAALTTQDGRTYAFRVADGRAKRVGVALGVVGTEDAEVHRGLAEGDQVVVGRITSRLADGVRVEVDGQSPDVGAPGRLPTSSPRAEGDGS
jgi:RND family efflux transporter MFP subunit